MAVHVRNRLIGLSIETKRFKPLIKKCCPSQLSQSLYKWVN